MDLRSRETSTEMEIKTPKIVIIKLNKAIENNRVTNDIKWCFKYNQSTIVTLNHSIGII